MMLTSNITNTFIPSNNPSLTQPHRISPRRNSSQLILCTLRDLRTRIESIKNTQKITEAMKLVSAARVRKAQEAVLNGRPFSEALLRMLHEINQQLTLDSVEVPLTQVRTPVRRVAVVVVTGDKGLCGGFNNAVLRKAETRVEELRKGGVEVVVVSVGKKGNVYFKRKGDGVEVDLFSGMGTGTGGGFPTAKEAQVIADHLFSMFVSEEVDKVDLVYTRFVSLLRSEPVVHSLLPLCPKGGVFDVNGNRVDAADDEVFRLTSKGGKLAVERDSVMVQKEEYMLPMEFEQDPVQILDALMPLYLNNQILRSLQESLASELAARMNAMSSATDNALELKKNLSVAYNRQRQAKITGEILELVAGADALAELD